MTYHQSVMPYVATIAPTDLLSSLSLVKITASFVGLYRFTKSIIGQLSPLRRRTIYTAAGSSQARCAALMRRSELPVPTFLKYCSMKAVLPRYLDVKAVLVKIE